MTSKIHVAFDDRLYPVHIRTDLITEIEEELGPISALCRDFNQDAWRVGDLVSLIQMFLQSARRTVDYAELGDAMLESGLDPYLAAAREFFDRVLQSRRTTACSFRKVMTA